MLISPSPERNALHKLNYNTVEGNSFHEKAGNSQGVFVFT
jgi:hypothetical protein